MAESIDGGPAPPDGDQDEAAGTDALIRRFRAVWARTADAPAELLPGRLAEACRQAMAVDGVGLSVISDRHRVPIGASDGHVLVAEQLQFTVGTGPCLDALRRHRSVRVDAEAIRREWPQFHDGLVRRTPYRSIAAVPLTITSRIQGALDIYSRDPAGARSIRATDTAAVAELVSTLLGLAGAGGGEPVDAGSETPAWMLGPSARDRLTTWVAVGVVMVRTGTSSDDALAMLRAHAFAREQTLDDLAGAVVDGRVDYRDLDLD